MYIFNYFWHNFLIIPLVNGKLCTKGCWNISWSSVKNPSQWNFIMQDLPQQVIRKLNLEVIESDDLNTLSQLVPHITALQFYLEHFIDFKRLPTLQKNDTERLQEYFRSTGKSLGEVAMSVINYCNQTFEIANKYVVEDIDLLSIGKEIEHIMLKVAPSEARSQNGGLNLDQVESWLKDVKHCIQTARVITNYITSTVLK